MKVSLLDYTGIGFRNPWYAAELMIFTKNTRVKMAPNGLSEIAGWTEEKKMEELAYMANTIRSSWEFCDYTFLLEGVTRALTHQLVRTRTASYAQQTQQILDMEDFTVEQPTGLSPNGIKEWDSIVDRIKSSYRYLIDNCGSTIEQARGLLPTNIHTNIVVKMNLRTLVDVIHTRVSPRNLGEFRGVAVAMRDAVLQVHPWSAIFLEQTRDKVLADMDAMILDLRSREPELATRLLKSVDQIRRG